MKLSINLDWNGKPEKRKEQKYDAVTKQKVVDKNGDPVYIDAFYCGEQKVYLGYNWQAAELEYDEVFDLLTVDGIAVAPALTCANKKDEFFDECSLALIDIDNGMTILELLDHPFYDAYAAGFYATPNYTYESPRFRIIHVLEQPITNAEQMRKLYRGLFKFYTDADVACKDASRLFYGTINCELKEKRNVVLSADMVGQIIALVEAEDEKNIKAYDEKPHIPLSSANRQQILDKLRQCSRLDFAKWRDIGFAMRKEGFSLADFTYATNEPSESTAAASIWESWKSANVSPNMGTIINVIKSQLGNDWFKDLSKPTQGIRLIYNEKANTKRLIKGY